MGEWVDCKLEDIASVQTGPFGSQLKNEQYVDGGTPVITVEHIKDFRVANFTYPSVTEEDKLRLNRYSLKSGDIVFTRVGSVDLSAFVAPAQNGWLFSSRMLRVRANADFIDAKFLSYFFRQNSFREHILNISVGATMPSINTKILETIEISYPPLPEQKAIAEVLSSLDDKIDLLHRQNKTLESLAETLFRQYFIENAQDDWEVRKLGGFIDIRDGTHDSPKQSSVGKYLITSRHISDFKIDYSSAYMISDSDFEKVNKRSEVNQGDILFSMIGTLGLLHFVFYKPDYAIKNIGLIRTSKNLEFSKFIYLLFKSDLGNEFIFENSSGSTQQYISLSALRDFEINVPDKVTLDSFNQETDALFLKIFSNCNQIKKLENLRDTLLPKLMNGDVRVEV